MSDAEMPVDPDDEDMLEMRVVCGVCETPYDVPLPGTSKRELTAAAPQKIKVTPVLRCPKCGAEEEGMSLLVGLPETDES